MKLFYALSLFLLVAQVQAETVYECRQNGKVVYTSAPGAGCAAAELRDSVTGYRASPAGSIDTSPSGAGDRAFPDGAREEVNFGNAEPGANDQSRAERIAAAEKALEEGKKVRLGNERNYAKYQERIRRLEENLERARAGQ